MSAAARCLCRFHRDDRAAVIVSFTLTLPIFWTIAAIYVQLSLLMVARLYVNHAAWVTGRAAAVLLPQDEPRLVVRAAQMALAPLSPAGPSMTEDASSILTALRGTGLNYASRYGNRFTHATKALTRVTLIIPSGSKETRTRFSDVDGGENAIILDYDFFLTVPVAKQILSRQARTIGGVTGRYYHFTSKIPFERGPGRKYGKSAVISVIGELEQ